MSMDGQTDARGKQYVCDPSRGGDILMFRHLKNFTHSAKTQSDRDIQRGICYGLITSLYAA